MKKNLLVSALLLILAFGTAKKAEGQAAIIAFFFGDKVASENFNISLEFGTTQPWYNEVEDSRRSRVGINFGIGTNIKLSENWFLCPNAYFLGARSFRVNSFSPTTGNMGINDAFANSEMEIILKYIDVPVFLHYQTNNKKYRFGIAPQVSFFSSAEATFTRDEGKFTQDVKDEVNGLDYGLIGNVTYVLGKAHKGRGILIHLRYYYGFEDVFKNRYIAGDNNTQFVSLHLSLPFITDELAAKNLAQP